MGLSLEGFEETVFVGEIVVVGVRLTRITSLSPYGGRSRSWGGAIGPVVGGLLLEHFWWGSVFIINVPVVVVAFISTLVVAPKIAGDRSKPWDSLSSVQALAALSALVVAIKEAASVDPSRSVLWIASIVTVVAGILLARRQTRLLFPLLDFSLFRNPAFSSGVIAAALMMFAIGGVQLVTPQRFQLVAGYSPLETGLLVSAAAIGSLPTALLGGAFLRRIGLRYLIAGRLGAGSLSVLLTAWGLAQGKGWVLAGLFLTGAGLGPPRRLPPRPSSATRPCIAPAWRHQSRKCPMSSATCSPSPFSAACFRRSIRCASSCRKALAIAAIVERDGITAVTFDAVAAETGLTRGGCSITSRRVRR